MNVQLFIPCFVDQLYPQTAFNMVKVLEKAGCAVSYNTTQTCCGQPAFNAGFWDEAKSVCTKFLKDFKGTIILLLPVPVVPALYVIIIQNFLKILRFINEVTDTGNQLFEFSDFLVKVLKVENVGNTEWQSNLS